MKIKDNPIDTTIDEEMVLIPIEKPVYQRLVEELEKHKNEDYPKTISDVIWLMIVIYDNCS